MAFAVYAQDRTAKQLTPVDRFSITGYPYYGTSVTPSDAANLPKPGYVRANEAGQVTAACLGNGAGNQITLNLAAGQVFPCLVSRVYDTDTDAITLHVFY